MATFSHLPSGKWRAQVRRAGLYRNATFEKKRDAEAWASGIETQAHHIAASGFAPIPQGATLDMLVDKYPETFAKSPGKTKTATLAMLKREIGNTKLASLSALVLRDFIDMRIKAGAGGVTIAADLSFLSAVLDELKRLYAHWGANKRQRVAAAQKRWAYEVAKGIQHGELPTSALERRMLASILRTAANQLSAGTLRRRGNPKFERKLPDDDTAPLMVGMHILLGDTLEDAVQTVACDFAADDNTVMKLFRKRRAAVADDLADTLVDGLSDSERAIRCGAIRGK